MGASTDDEKEPEHEPGADADSDSDADNTALALELTAVVWMRKSPVSSGRGPFFDTSTSSHRSGSWERHRVALRGNELVHYRAALVASAAASAAAAATVQGGGHDDDDGDVDATRGNDRTSSSSSSSSAATSNSNSNSELFSSGAESKSKSKSKSNSKKSTESDPLLPRKLMRKAAAAATAAKDNVVAGRGMAMDAIPPLKYATDNVKAAAVRLSHHSCSDDGADGSDDAPRGTLDLSAAGNAAVAVVAESPDSDDGVPPPTPFTLSVTGRDGKAGDATNTTAEETARQQQQQQWTMCFDSQSRQMEWLTALTDVLVSVSVGTYNANMVARRAADEAGEEKERGKKKGGRPATSFMPRKLRDKLHFHATKSTQRVTWDDYVGSIDGADGRDPIVTAKKQLKEQGEEDNLEVAVVDEILPLDANLFWLPLSPNLVVMLIFVNGAIFASTMVSMTTLVLCVVAAITNGCIWVCLVKKSPGVKMAILSSEASPDADTDDALPSVMAMTSRTLKRMSLMDVASAVSETVASTIVPSLIAESSYRPLAGTTTMRIANPTDPAVNEDGHQFAGWRAVPGSLFRVRSHGYAATKTKVPSPSELYDLAHVDIFESSSRCADITKRVRLPEVSFGEDENDSGNQTTKTWCSPDVFVVSFALPTGAPRLGSPTDEGEGYTVTMYYTMKEQTRDVLRRITSPDGTAKNTDGEEEETDVQKRISSGVRLWEEWCRKAPTDPEFQARFKVICNAHNLKEIGVPSWISRYNEKPFLIKRAGKTGFLYTHPDVSAIEFDISFHGFPYVFKQATSYLKEHYFNKILVTFGFCIEGRDDDELPEIMIGEGMQLCYPDPAIAIQAGDWFGGSSPVSF